MSSYDFDDWAGIAAGFIVVFVLTVVFSAIFAVVTMWLWNWLMPDLFGIKEIGFWQAFGINILCSILFKGSNSTSRGKSSS